MSNLRQAQELLETRLWPPSCHPRGDRGNEKEGRRKEEEGQGEEGCRGAEEEGRGCRVRTGLISIQPQGPPGPGGTILSHLGTKKNSKKIENSGWPPRAPPVPRGECFLQPILIQLHYYPKTRSPNRVFDGPQGPQGPQGCVFYNLF